MLNVDKRLAEAKERHREARESRQNARRDVRNAQWQVRILAEKHHNLERRVKDKPTDKLMYEVMELEVELEDAKKKEKRAQEEMEKVERNIEQLGQQIETIQRNLEALRRMEKIEAERHQQKKEKERQKQRMREEYAKTRQEYARAREESDREYSKRRKTNNNKSQSSSSRQNTTPPARKTPTPSLADINRKFLDEVTEWRKVTQNAFADYASITTFPEPPSKPCRNKTCAATANYRELKACRCNIEDAFRALPAVEMKAKKERTRWHPDRFSAAKVTGREMDVLRKKAQEVFVVLNDMAEGLVYGKEPDDG